MTFYSAIGASLLGLAACAHPHTSDTQAIRDVLDRASDAINHGEWSTLDVLVTEDVIWEARPPVSFTLHGRDELQAFLRTNMAVIDLLLFSVAATAIEVIDADHARARSTMNELIRVKATGAGLQVVGTYVDQLVRRDGRWQIARRTFTPRFEADVPVPARIFADGVTRSATEAFPGGKR